MKKIFLYSNLLILVLFANTNQAQWIIQDIPFPKNDLTEIKILNQNDAVIVGGWGTILATDNGGDIWSSISNDTINWFNSTHFINKDTGWVVGVEIIKSTTDRGRHWLTQFNTHYNFFNSVHFSNSGTGWAVGYFSNDGPPLSIIYKTTNGGFDWEYQDPGISTYSWSSICFVNNAMGWIVGGGWFSAEIIKTINRGQIWTNQLSTDGYFNSIYFINELTGWAVGTETISGVGLICKTNDGGSNWINQSVGIITNLNDVYFCNENIGWAVGLGGMILNTTNGGLSWDSQISGTNLNLNSIEFLDENIGWIVGEDGIILKTLNGGITPVELINFFATVQDNNIQLDWSTASELNNKGFDIQRNNDGEFEKIGFVNGHGTTTESQAYSFTDKNVVTGKYNYRLKQIDFDGTFEFSNVVEAEVTSPSTFSLEQNYPNPFNPSTSIQYQVSSISIVSLKVYDVLGNEVATLVNEEKPAGSYEVEFEASSLTSGIYFYKLKGGNFVETKKMIFLR